MKQANGFTLIELLVAMTAGALLLASLGWAVSTLGREAREDPRSEELRQLLAVRAVLTNLIESGENTREHPFLVEANRLTVRTSPPQALGPVGPVELTLTVVRSREGEDLIARLSPEEVALPPEAAGPFPLLSGYERIDFEPVMAATGDEPQVEAVRIRLRSPSGQENALVAAPRVNSSGSCIFDPISMACRP